MAYDRVVKVKEREGHGSFRQWRIKCPYILVDIGNSNCKFVYEWINSSRPADVSVDYSIATLNDMGYDIIEDLGNNYTYVQQVREHMNSIRVEGI